MNASKKSHDLGADCYAICQTNKGKSVPFPFKEGPAPKICDPFFDKYPMPELEMGREENFFLPDWDLNVNDRSIDPKVCAEMLDHVVLPQDIMFAS